MKTILYVALSADGFIAGLNDETPWSDEEWAAFQEFVKTCDTEVSEFKKQWIKRQQNG